MAIYPEYSYILIGDNGQGDVRTAEMVRIDIYRKRVNCIICIELF